jgi:pimeloyl-ACP methyl ester carboxylesterase
MIAHTPPAGAAAALRGRALRKDYTESLTRISVPTLIVAGTEDSYVTLETARQMNQSISGSHLEIFNGIGHLPNLEATDQFNATLQKFLDTIPAR